MLVIAPKPRGGRASLAGDALGVTAALFYGTYLLMVARPGGARGPGSLMFWSTLVCSLALLPLALDEKFLPDTGRGAALLAGLALIAQAFGQGLIAYALARPGPGAGPAAVSRERVLQ